MNLIELYKISELEDKKIYWKKVVNTELIIVKNGEDISVLYGRCLHRKALLKDWSIKWNDVICGVHNWDYNMSTWISDYNPSEKLQKFTEIIKDWTVFVDEEEIKIWEKTNPQIFDENSLSWYHSDWWATQEEPYVKLIQSLSKQDLLVKWWHWESVSMWVRDEKLPKWEDIQIVTAQLAIKPLLDEDSVDTTTIIWKSAKKPLVLKVPLFISDMSFGALSREAKISLSKWAQMAGTWICSWEGWVLPEEQAENSYYFYEYASGKFWFSWEKVQKSQAFHFKFWQWAKTWTGGHLPWDKVTEEIAKVRGLKVWETAVSPSTFKDWWIEDYKKFAEEVREKTGWIPIGVKLSAQHIEKDIEAALEIGVDYIILDGRWWGTGSSPRIFRNNISVPTIPALARARAYLDKVGRTDITLVATWWLRTPDDFAKALALWANAVALSNSVIQAVWCVGMRACGTNNCPVGIATQREDLRARLIIDKAANKVKNFINSSTHLMNVLAKACWHSKLSDLQKSDLTTFNYEMHRLTGIEYWGIK